MSAAALVRRVLPFAVSAVALLIAFQLADLNALRGLQQRINWSMLPAVALLVLAIVAAFAWRWLSLLRHAVRPRRCLLIVALGLAGNQVLPLRGGDALRVMLSARGTPAASLHAAVSALAMEKVFDLIAVAAFGLASTAALMSANGDGSAKVMLIAVSILVLATSALLAARSRTLGNVLRGAARLGRIRPSLYRHAARPVQHLRHLASPAGIMALLGKTALLWLTLYVLAYLAIARFVGLAITPADAMVLLFAGALGLAIPAAPSGIGTFHAAIVSAFVLLDRPASDGLVLAVAVHGVFFIGFCLIGAVALALATRQLGPIRLRGESV